MEEAKIPELATVHATAARMRAEGLPFGEPALIRWVKDGQLPYVPNGNRRMINWDTLMAFLATGVTERPAAPPPPRYGPGSRGGKR